MSNSRAEKDKSKEKNYQCLDCSAKANKTIQGRCAACGSAKVRSLNKLEEPKEKEAQPVRLLLMMLLWAFMIYKSYETFIAS